MQIKLSLLIVSMLFVSVSVAQDFLTFYPKSEVRTVRDTFYVEVGWISKGTYNNVDQRSPTSQGFYRKRGNQFYTDTLYSLIGRNNPFRELLDSMGVTYTVNDNWVNFVDSVIKHTKRSKFIKKELVGINGKSQLVFWPVSMVMRINESYQLFTRIPNSYEFKGKGLVYTAQRRMIYKPILHYEVQPL
jgi:hypothetical protein